MKLVFKILAVLLFVLLSFFVGYSSGYRMGYRNSEETSAKVLQLVDELYADITRFITERGLRDEYVVVLEKFSERHNLPVPIPDDI